MVLFGLNVLLLPVTHRLVRRASSVGLLLLWLGSAAAYAHGPCHCLPATAVPGDRVVTNNVFRAIWNPTREDIYYEQSALVAAHVKGTPRLVLVDRDRSQARQDARFFIPAVPAGKYLVLLYDGSEGGEHYTWDTINVRRGRVATSASSRPKPSTANGFPIGRVVFALVVLMAAGALLTHRRRDARHNDREPPDDPSPSADA